MANEYLKRTPTSTGNRKVVTISAWYKNNKVVSGGHTIFSSGMNPTSPDGRHQIDLVTNSNPLWQFEQYGFPTAGGSIANYYARDVNRKFRDFSSWSHIMVSFDSTKPREQDRAILYHNGVRFDKDAGTSNFPQNFELPIGVLTNNLGIKIGNGVGALQYGSTYFNGQLTDYFFVDGQALTPDVFGFYKDGDGYQSSGTDRATDFRPGQWMPHAPRVIKKSIERSGGFGANGFYLPMNDSSNPGADFHCDPNSIIKLKGEDLPQPQNGAPTTSDAFVSQLRQETGTLGFDGCVKLLRTGGYLDLGTGHSDLVPGSGDFTIECFLYPQEFGNFPVIVDSRTSSSDTLGFFLGFNTNGQLYLYTHSGERNAIILTKGRWYHIALVRQSNVFKLYVDGVKVGTDYTQSQNYTNQIRYIGESSNGESQNWNIDAFISNFRFVKGTAVYTGNFTAPTESLTNVTNTKLLCCNSSTSATAATVKPGDITNNGAFATRNELTGSMVLAVPGISVGTTNLVSNGDFSNGTTGWTISDASEGSMAVVNGQLVLTNNNTSDPPVYAWQQITTISGKTYTLQVDLPGGTSASHAVYLNDSSSFGSTYGQVHSNAGLGTKSTTFVAAGTSVFVLCRVNTNSVSTSIFDNIIVREETVRDYSADIRGSGTNKTLTPVGNAGVGYELGNYYGSAMTFDGNGDEFTIPANVTDLQLGGGDFTIESWIYPRVYNSGNMDWIGKNGGSAAASEFEYGIFSDGRVAFYHSNGSTYSNTGVYGLILPAGTAPVDQWTHIVGERHGNTFTAYINGVAAGVVQNFLSGGSMPSGTADTCIGSDSATAGTNWHWDGRIQDLRIYKGLAKYKGGFDVPKPYTPVGIEAFRTTADTCKNNFATWNPLLGRGRKDQLTYSDGNLKVVSGATGGFDTTSASTMAIKGKIYCEFVLSSSAIGAYVGVMKYDTALTNNGIDTSGTSDIWLVRGDNGHKANGSTSAYAGSAFSNGDIIMLAVDIANTSIWWGKNGTWFASGNPAANSNAGYTNLPSTEDLLVICGDNFSSETPHIIANFGQNPAFSGTLTAGTNADDSGKGLFKYAPPTGFLALCEDNLPTPAIADPGKHFKCVFYTGDNSAGRRISDVGFQPDLVWVKARNATVSHILTDSVRGIGHQLSSDDNSVEVDSGTFYLNGFADNGFDLGDGANSGGNTTGRNYVAWCWKAGGAAVSNTDGTITSQVSANQTAGFSIVSYTSDNTNANKTVGHGLNKTPKFIIVKARNEASRHWLIWHDSFDDYDDAALFTTGAAAGSRFGPDAPTSDVFGVYGGQGNRGTTTFISYCWAEIEGYSKFGSYTGNGSTDGPFVYCGFKPAFILVKNADAGAGHWVLWDSSRTPNNDAENAMLPDRNLAETSGFVIDFLSNGFKLRDGETSLNNSGDTHIFVAFAESPFQTANAK